MAKLTYTGAQLDAAIRKVRSDFADVSGVDLLATEARLGKKYIDASKQEVIGTMPDAVITPNITVTGGKLTDTESDFPITITPKATVGTAGYTDNISDGTAVMKYINTEEKSVSPTTAEQEITPSADKLIFKVTVAAIQTEEKTCTPSASAQEITPTYGKYLSKVTVNAASGGEQPTLNAPSLSIIGSTLTITNPSSNGSFSMGFRVYANGELLVSTASSSINLKAYITASGTFTITAKCYGTNFTDSPSSNAVSYTVRPKLSAPTVSITNKTLSITDTSGGASSFNIYLNGSYVGFVNKATSGSTTYPLYRLALERTTYTIGISAVPPSGSSYDESALTNKSYTYSNSGYSVTISSYFTYIDNVTVTFHFTGGTTATYTLATLQNSYQGHTFSNVYKVTATHSATSWYCYFYSGSYYYYLEPAGGETDAAINIEWNCTMNSETEQSCITADSLVTMADGTQKALGEIHTGEYIRSFDWDTMMLVSNKVIYSGCEQENWDEWYCQRYFKWTFSDGTVIKNCFSHRFYNKEAKAFIYLEYWRIGDHTYKADGTNPYLVSMETINERVRYGRISGENGTNYFANNLLTGDRHCPTNIILPPE